MANNQLPTPDELRQLLRYDPESGKLFWRERSLNWFEDAANRTATHKCRNWNARYAGSEAFSAMDAHGYLVGSIQNVKYKSHRVIWAMVYDEWPSSDVDHINSDRSDNRQNNLRMASRSQNMRNRGATKSNSTGLKGVCWDSGRQKWLAQIRVNGRNKYLGRYDTPECAHLAYKSAAAKIHGDFARST